MVSEMHESDMSDISRTDGETDIRGKGVQGRAKRLYSVISDTVTHKS